MKKNILDQFIDLSMKLEPAEFVGICKILGVEFKPIDKGEWTDEDTYNLISQAFFNFKEKPATRQKEIIKVMKEAVK